MSSPKGQQMHKGGSFQGTAPYHMASNPTSSMKAVLQIMPQVHQKLCPGSGHECMIKMEQFTVQVGSSP